jgi:zinc D-Ala-D-Ala carboxypeptidase
MKKKHFILFVVIIVAAGLCWFWFIKKDTGAPASNKTTSKSSTQTSSNGIAPGEPAPSFNKKQFSLTDPTSLWVVANKQRPLNPATYAPSDLVVPNIPLAATTNMEKQVRKDMAAALETMVSAGNQQGVKLNLQSGYRSYNFQVNLYNRYVQQQGKAVADSQSARPGYSEHQTGWAADLGSVDNPNCDVAACFGDTADGKWLAANAYKYGFIIRYPKGMDNVTGYIYEPWHVRYVGTALSTEMHNRGIATLEEFFGTGNAPDYN